MLRSIPFRATPPVGGMSSAARRSRCSSCRFSPAFCWRWSMFLSAGEAWNSLNVLNHQIPLAGFCAPCTAGARTSWSPSFSRMAQVYLFGAYEFPRELTSIFGVFLLLMTLGMAFTGQVLRFSRTPTGVSASAHPLPAVFRSSAAASCTCCSAGQSSPGPRS